MSKKVTFHVHSPLRHDGKTYQPGGKVSLTAEEAEPLQEAGVISAPEKPEEPEKDEAATEQAGTAAKQKGGAGKTGNAGGKKGNG